MNFLLSNSHSYLRSIEKNINGESIYTHKNGDIEKGFFKNGKLNGVGEIIFKKVGRITGLFKDGFFSNGYFFEKIRNNYRLVFNGIFENGSVQKGTEFYPSGVKKFIGTYENGSRKEGEEFYDSYEKQGYIKFRGEFEENKYKNGIEYIYRYGNKTYATGSLIIEKEYSNGKNTSLKIFRDDSTIYYDGNPSCTYGTIFTDEGHPFYIGKIKKLQRHGNGILFFKNTNIIKYEGMFKNSLYEGRGKEYREDGTLFYEGYFKYGKLHGKGIQYKENGIDIFSKGKFIDGNFYDEELFSIRKFLETNDFYNLEHVKKQKIISFINDTFNISLSKSISKKDLSERLKKLYSYDKKINNIEETSEDLFGNIIQTPCLGNDGGIYDIISMEYLFKKNEEGDYINIPYSYDENSTRIPNFPRMNNGIPLSTYTLQ